MKPIAATSVLAMAIAATASVAFVGTLKPSSGKAFLFFSLWLIAPYALMSTALIMLKRKSGPLIFFQWLTIVISIGGVVFRADVIYWHSGAQGALVVVLIPILQVAATIVLTPICWWMSRRISRQ